MKQLFSHHVSVENDYFEDSMGDESFNAVIALDKVPKSS